MATKKTAHTISAEKMEAYEKMITSVPGIELKGVSMPYTSHKGHMFSYFEKDGSFGLRLAEKEREAFLKKYKTKLFVSYGIIKKDFVTVPEQLLLHTKEILPWFRLSYRLVDSMKAK